MCSLVDNRVDSVNVPPMSSLISLPHPLHTSLTSKSRYIYLCQKADLGLLEPSLSQGTHNSAWDQYSSRDSLQQMANGYGGTNVLDTWILGWVMLQCMFYHIFNISQWEWTLVVSFFIKVPFIDCLPFHLSPPHSYPVYSYLPNIHSIFVW